VGASFIEKKYIRCFSLALECFIYLASYPFLLDLILVYYKLDFEIRIESLSSSVEKRILNIVRAYFLKSAALATVNNLIPLKS
jgi:hypothetical protein